MAPRARRLALIALAAALVAAAAVGLWRLRGPLPGQPGTPPIFPTGALRVGVDPSNPPFAVASGARLSGLDIDLARALGQRLGVPVTFVSFGFDGLYDALKTDQVDALISAVLVDTTRTNDVMYTLPYFNAGLVLVSAADSLYSGMSAMPGHSVAFEFGSNADAETRRWLRRVLPFERRPYELTTDALDAARLGQADAALADAISARLYLRAHPTWAAQFHYVTDANYAIAVRVDRGAVWDALNSTLATMIADGSLDALVARWL